MGSFQHPRAFHPLDLEIMDHVYEAAWAQLEARDPFRNQQHDGERADGAPAVHCGTRGYPTG